MAVDRSAPEPVAALDLDLVSVRPDAGAEGLQSRDDPGDPVRFLVAQLPDAADPAATGRHRGGEAEDRDLVDRTGDLGGAHVDSVERAAPDGEVRDRLAGLAARAGSDRPFLDLGAHPPQQVDDPTPRRVRPDVSEEQVRVRMDGRRDQPEGRPGNVAGNLFIERHHRRWSRHRMDGAPVAEELGADRNAPRAQHPLRVVARQQRLVHGRRSRGGQPGQQHARLHLGARNGRDVLDAAQRRRPRDRERRAGRAGPADHRCAHRRQGRCHASHRALPE